VVGQRDRDLTALQTRIREVGGLCAIEMKDWGESEKNQQNERAKEEIGDATRSNGAQGVGILVGLGS